jgi:hypothetical protein
MTDNGFQKNTKLVKDLLTKAEKRLSSWMVSHPTATGKFSMSIWISEGGVQKDVRITIEERVQ